MKLESPSPRDSLNPHHFPRCEQCDSLLMSPDWSEQISVRCVRHLWLCDACGYQFEQMVYFAKN
jgi:hypothetical protein